MIYGSQLAWQQNKGYGQNEHSVTVQESLNGKTFCKWISTKLILNVPIQNQAIWKADVPLIGIRGIPPVRVGVAGREMQLIGNHTHFRPIRE